MSSTPFYIPEKTLDALSPALLSLMVLLSGWYAGMQMYRVKWEMLKLSFALSVIQAIMRLKGHVVFGGMFAGLSVDHIHTHLQKHVEGIVQKLVTTEA